MATLSAIDADSLKIAALIAVGLLAVFFLGMVLRIVTWVAVYGVMALVVVAVAYAAYELYSGWSAAGEDAAGRERTTGREGTSIGGQSSRGRTDTVADAREGYVEGTLSEAEFERELETLLQEDGIEGAADDRDREFERER